VLHRRGPNRALVPGDLVRDRPVRPPERCVDGYPRGFGALGHAQAPGSVWIELRRPYTGCRRRGGDNDRLYWRTSQRLRQGSAGRTCFCCSAPLDDVSTTWLWTFAAAAFRQSGSMVLQASITTEHQRMFHPTDCGFLSTIAKDFCSPRITGPSALHCSTGTPMRCLVVVPFALLTT